MSFDWTSIGDQVSLLHLEMNYPLCEEYTIEQLKIDLEIGPGRNPVYDVECDYNSYEWVTRFKYLLEKRRRVLTKMFAMGNNPNGVDTLIEYCDYYKNQAEDDSLSKTKFNVPFILGLAFRLLCKNDDATAKMVNYVWAIHCVDIRCSTVEFHRQYNSFPPNGAAMVIMAGADLSAAILAHIRSRNSAFEISRVLVQEPIAEELLDTAQNYRCKIEVLSDLYIFRNAAEALESLHGTKQYEVISIWSENIIAAKKFAADSGICTIWINAHGDLHPGLESLTYYVRPLVDCFGHYNFKIENDSPVDDTKPAKSFDLFYGGKWQTPTEGKYWTNHDKISYAEATRKDLEKCVSVAYPAFKVWRSTRISKRAQTLKCFAKRLEANGESKCADLILKLVDLPLVHGSSLSVVKDGEAEISNTREPIGVVVVGSNDQNELFEKLVVASVAGNAVIVLLNSKSSVSFAPYCDMLATCGFPAGVINCLFTNGTTMLNLNTESIKKVIGNLKVDLKLLTCCEIDVPKTFGTRYNMYKKMFSSVTRAKSVWLQCG